MPAECAHRAYPDGASLAGIVPSDCCYEEPTAASISSSCPLARPTVESASLREGAVGRVAAGPLPHWSAWVFVASLPLLLLAADREWIVSGPHPDYWLYHGWFRNAFEYLRDLPAHYQASRLSVYLVGMAFHALLPPLVANLALHLALAWVTLGAFFFAAASLTGCRPALLATVCMAFHPFFAQAIGKNYVDGFGICYFLLALSCLVVATRGIRPGLALTLGGACLVAAVSANLLYLLYAPGLAALFWAAARPRTARKTLSSLLWIGAGAGALALLLGLVSRAGGGALFFFAPSLSFARNYASGVIADIWRQPAAYWLGGATWLVLPGATALGALLWLGARRWRGADRPLLGVVLQLQMLLVAGFLLAAHVRGWLSVLQHFYATSLLLPLAFLALAGQIASVLPAFPRPRFEVILAVLVVAGALPWICDVTPSRTHDLLGASPVVPLGTIASLGVFSLLCRPGSGALALRLLAVVGPAGLALAVMPERAPERDHWGYYRQTTEIIALIESYDPSFTTRLWYTPDDPAGPALHSVGASFMLCPRVVNIAFPRLDEPVLCGQAPLRSGQRIAVLSSLQEAPEQAVASLAKHGFVAAREGQERVSGAAGNVVVTFLRAERSCPIS
jgi:hypothetical protein